MRLTRTTTMKRQTWLIPAVLALMVGLWGGAGPADAGVIYPIDPATGAPNPSSTVTVSVFDAFGADITDTWLPTWAPGTSPVVYVAFNSRGLPATATATLVPPRSPVVFDGLTNPFVALPVTTSAYPGRCTNFGPPDLTPDYDLGAAETRTLAGVARQAFALTSQDCGGMAVLTAVVNNAAFTFIVPQDSNRNGIPDIWEARFCPNNSCPTGREDNDTGPLAGTPVGDGIAAFDEYRGVIRSGVHVSTDPRQRDLFVHLVNPQCGAASLLGGGTTTYPTDGTSLFENLQSLLPGTAIHLLGYNPRAASGNTEEWVDRFSSFSQQTGFQFVNPDGTVGGGAPADDRRVNANALYPLGVTTPVGTVHKGLRITECLDVSATQPLGNTGIGSPEGPDNSVVYTQRIVNYINGLIDAGQGRRLRIFVFRNGAWAKTFESQATPSPSDRNVVLSQAMKFYAAHELTHSTRLTPTVEGTKQTSYGYHHAPLTGSVMDQAIVQKIDKSASGFNSFYVPALYNSSDQGSYVTD
jgi:hypothetical protein